MKPLLAATLEPDDVDSLRFPVIASPKLDGIRCLIKDGVALSRTLKPIPNTFVQQWAAAWAKELDGCDGELIVGEHDEEVFRRTTSGVMSHEGTPNFTYWVFDEFTYNEESYARRWRSLIERAVAEVSRVKLCPRAQISNGEELLEFESKCLGLGFEGVMIRNPSGKYKYGRSTLKEGTLLKLKRFEDNEAIIVGVEQFFHNTNKAKKDDTGATVRSSEKAGLVPLEKLGALVARTPEGITFSIGSGFSDGLRTQLWQERESLVGKMVKYKYFPQGGKEAPRFPIFLGFRHQEDV